MLNILVVPDKRLYLKAESVEVYSKLMKSQVAEMFELVADNMGLAAPQVGINQRFFITNFEGEKRLFINPVIQHRAGLVRSVESCLSVPGVKGQVTRARKVTVEAFDSTCERVRINAEGIFSILIQHEMDHLDGILFDSKIKKITH